MTGALNTFFKASFSEEPSRSRTILIYSHDKKTGVAVYRYLVYGTKGATTNSVKDARYV
jgi:hypothetical protein